MSQRLELKKHLRVGELKARYLSCSDPKEARRWQALWLISQGYSSEQAGQLVGFQGSWVRRVINRYNEKGPEAIIDGHRTNPGGVKPHLNSTQREKLFEALKGPPPSGGLWTGPKVANWIKNQTGKDTYPQLGWVYLKDLGFSLKVPRRKHAKAASQGLQAAFKKSPKEGKST